jgi:Tfp pilus assembly protein PilO
MTFIKSFLAFISKLSNRERLIFYVTLAVVGIVVLDRLALSPILSKTDELRETITLQEEAIEQSLIIVTEEDRIKKEIELYAPYLSQSDTEEKEVATFLKEVENIAKQSSVYLVDIKPAGKTVEGAATRYFVKLNFEAEMEQVMAFFYNISGQEQLLGIESYEIAPKVEGASVVACSASVSKTIIPQ